MPALDPLSASLILVALALGGLLKGATGAGAPVVAVPVVAAFFDVRLAVAMMAVPNLLTNLWQSYSFRAARPGGSFTWKFALAGAAGAFVGTTMLAVLPERLLTLLVAGAVTAYVGLRLARPDFRLATPAAQRLALPAGAVAGILQGAAGISAPVSVSFLNAMRLERTAFIATIAVFFTAMSVVQLPTLYAYGLTTPALLGLSALALVPLTAAMPVGAWAARRLSPQGFDRLTLAFLSLLALRLIYTAFA